MSIQPFVIDAHSHFGPTNLFFSPEYSADELLSRMDSVSIEISLVCGDMDAMFAQSPASNIENLQEVYEGSGGRLPFLAVFDPRGSARCLEALRRGMGLNGSPRFSGFRGIKIHPVFHSTPAEDPSYEPVWRFAAENNLPIMSHTWSISSYNPPQALSTPDRFEKWVKKFPSVRFILGHSGGRGTGRFEAIRMTNEYENVYMDFGGDIYCYRYMERMTEQVPVHKILFGSDWPWMDPRSHLTRVYLAEISTETKRKILRDNAMEVYGLDKDG